MTPGLVLVLVAMAAEPPSRYEPDREPKTLDELYLAYRWHGLPLPPTDAVLIRWVERGYLRGGEGVEEEKVPRLGLMVRKLSGSKPAIVWGDGYVYEEVRASRLQPVLPLAKYLDRDVWFAEDLVTLAAQAYHLGWTELAHAAFDRAKTTARGGAYTPTAEDRDHILLTLRTMTWNESYRSLTEPGTDRKKLFRSLKLVADNDARFRSEYQTELLRGIGLTLRPSVARPGSLEAFIDGLTECDRTRASSLDPLAPPDAVDKLIERGFDAVPALVAHLDDGRVTRARDLHGANNSIMIHVCRVEEVCAWLLTDLAAETLPGHRDVTPAQFHKAVADWYEGAKKNGEEQWALAHVVRGDGGLNRLLLRLIRAKYPRHLPDLYKQVLGRMQGFETDAVAGEVAASTLDRETKILLLRQGVSSRYHAHRLPAVAALEHVDRTQFRKELKETLDWLSTAKLDDKAWEHQMPPHELAELVKRADDADCWAVLGRAYKAAPAHVRLKLLNHVGDFDRTRDPVRLKYPLRLLIEMLPDRTVRYSSRIDGFSHPGHAYPTLTVGDFAALRLADYLDYDVPWDQKRTASEWATIREAIRVQIERMLDARK